MTLDEFEQARARRKISSEKVADLLQQAPIAYKRYDMEGLRMRGMRMAKCGEFYAGDVCPVCHTFHATSGSRCRDRLCPNCGWLQAVERSTAVRRALDELGDRYAIYHVVLTMRDPIAADGAELHEQVKTLIDAYTRMVHRDKLMKGTVWGTVRSLEISNNGNARYHPHIHALWIRKIGDPPRGRMLCHEEICTIWQKALGVDYRPVCWIEPIYAKDTEQEGSHISDAVREACKYAIKPSLYEGADLQMLVELADGLKGVHMFQCTGGMAAAYRKAVKEIEEERETPKGKCPTCGAIADHVCLNWQDGGYVL
jgi:plasmid rolling circle replication initiator protein Rep